MLYPVSYGCNNNDSEDARQGITFSCRNSRKAVVDKLLNKTAVQYPLANDLVFLDSRFICDTDKNKSS